MDVVKMETWIGISLCIMMCSAYTLQTDMTPDQMSDKWIVVTTIQAPTEDMKSLNSVEGWKLVVIGDKKTPPNWKLEGAVYLDVEAQKKLPYKAKDVIPYGSYARKNIGYLYAIHHGAKFIYETDDDNRIVTLDIFQFSGEYHGLLVDTTSSVVNPYSHFGQSTIWPRGYPLDMIGKPQPRRYSFTRTQVPVIQQGVVDADPDVDAIFRLTRKPIDKMVNITFDGNAPAILLPHNTFSPFNSQNTLFLYDALPLCMLPISVTYRETDIYRSYWAQKLLSLIGHKLIFIPPKTIQIRNSHDFLVDARQELKLYFNMGRLSKYLGQWSCSSNTFFECILDLTRDLVKEKIYHQSDLDLVTYWLDDLTRMGYKQANMVKATNNKQQPKSVLFYPNEQKTCMLNTKENSMPPFSTNIETLTKYVSFKCGPYLAAKHSRQLTDSSKVKNTLLVVSVTGEQKNIIYLETIYKYYFSHILYCGKDQYNLDLKGITYIQLKQPSPITCVESAIQMDYNVEDIVHVSDQHYISAPPTTGNNVIKLVQSSAYNYLLLDSNRLNQLHNHLTTEQIHDCEGTKQQLVHVQKSEFTKFLKVSSICDNDQCMKKFSSLYCMQQSKQKRSSDSNSVTFRPLTDLYITKTYCKTLDLLQ